MKNAILTSLDDGGITLWALMLLAVMIYSLVLAVWWRGRQLRKTVDAEKWKQTANVQSNLPWQGSDTGRREWERRCAAFELDEIAWVERRIPFLAVLVAAAPLLGLLGTVAGMLVSFGGMASAGTAAPIDMIATGISRALVTTEAGLMIAIPGALCLALLKRQAQSTHTELQRQLYDELKGVKTA